MDPQIFGHFFSVHHFLRHGFLLINNKILKEMEILVNE
jgi:hypothetical protein